MIKKNAVDNFSYKPRFKSTLSYHLFSSLEQKLSYLIFKNKT